MNRFRMRTGGLLFAALPLVILALNAAAYAAEPGAEAALNQDGAKWAYVAAAFSVGLGCLGAGIAVAYVGAAAIAGVAENPGIAARALIFVGLAEGIAIYGLIIAIMILGKV
ncbi:MAG: F0F1 ATP synthase subunit C [Candidatus Hydrogenedentes bacterium]|nr:F0F1 ATP synthase subunit C [Candidatus Hydrogenedentota bacterium]